MTFLNLSPTPASDDFATESINPGCPMLIRAAAPHPTISGAILMRCALGWSIHDEIDCARCAGTTLVQDCWRVHPERTPVVAMPDAGDPTALVAGRHAAD
jgi:hypothetical protein